METNSLIAISSLSAFASLILLTLLLNRRSSPFILYRSKFYLLNIILSLALLVSSTAAPILLSKQLQIVLFFILHSLFIACYTVRLLKIMDTHTLNPIFFVLIYIFAGAAYSSPSLLVLVRNINAAFFMCLAAIGLTSLNLIFALGMFHGKKKDIVMSKKEILTVLVLSLANWTIFAVWTGTTETVSNLLAIPAIWMNFAISICVVYFCVALPLISTFRDSENSIYNRSRIISDRLLENENSFDEDLLSANQCLESVLFFKEVHDFVKDNCDTEERFEKALNIYQQFLGDRAGFELTVPNSVRRDIKNKLDAELVDVDVFNEAIEHVWTNNIEEMSQNESRLKSRLLQIIEKNIVGFLWWK